jgi:hypothetical protein
MEVIAAVAEKGLELEFLFWAVYFVDNVDDVAGVLTGDVRANGDSLGAWRLGMVTTQLKAD